MKIKKLLSILSIGVFAVTVLVSASFIQPKQADVNYSATSSLLVAKKKSKPAAKILKKNQQRTKKIRGAEKGSPSGLAGLCTSQSQCMTYCTQNQQKCLDYCENDSSGNSLCVQLNSMLGKGAKGTQGGAEDKSSMIQMMMQMMGGRGGDTGGSGNIVLFDPEKESLPKIAVKNFIDLDWQVQRISKFRGGYGHDYSFGTGETCRSMKHYFWAKGGDPGQPHNPPWMSIVLYAPADGVIERVNVSQNMDGPEAQFSLVADENKAFTFLFHHIRLESGLKNGSKVKAGEKLGTIGNEQNHAEIGVQIMTPRGISLVSFFEVATDEVLKEYAARGLAKISDVINTKEFRDAHPLSCDKNTVEGRFVGGSYDGKSDSAGQPIWFELQ